MSPSITIEGVPWIGYWAYPLLAVSVMVEGPIATLLAAVAASAGYMNPIGVFIFAVAGNTVSDTLWYGLGYLGALGTASRYLRWLGLRPRLIEQLEVNIQQNARHMLFMAKLTLGLVVPTLIATGLARVPWRRWSPALFLAECIWTGGLVTAGYFFGAYVQRLEAGLRYLAVGGAIVLLLTFGIVLLRRRGQGVDEPQP